MPDAAADPRQSTAACRLSFTWWGATKALHVQQKATIAESFNADVKATTAGKKLFDTKDPAYRALAKVKADITEYWYAHTLPYVEPGIRLIRRGQVPEFDSQMVEYRDRFAEGIIACVRELLVVRDHGFKTLVIDTLNGAQNMLVAHMIQTEYGGTPSKFHDFGRGWKPSRDEWLKFVDVLTRVNASGVSILLLAHADIVKFQNPEGLDYDRYVPRMNKLLWEPVQEWADMVLFGQLETFVKAEPGQQQAKKGKAFGGQERLLYCERTAVADAKNRHNLPGITPCGQGAEGAWNALSTAMAEGHKLPPKEPASEEKPDPQ